MAKGGTLKQVQCYHCRAQFEVSARAMTVSCPKCYKSLLVDDVTIKTAHGVTKLQTCGKLVVEKRGRVRAELVEAHGGIEVHGIIEGKVVSGGPIVVHEKAKWKGDCRAPTIRIAPGAKIERGFFEIGSGPAAEALGLPKLPGVR